jgi:hypothetical protein
MAWIELHQELFCHPKIVRVSKCLKKDYASTLGHLVSLWLWAVAYARDGELTDFSSDEIATACNAPDVQSMKKVLIETRWIDEKDGKLFLHDWKKHGVRILEQSRKRQAKGRRLKGLDDSNVTRQSRDSNVLLSLFLSSLSIPSLSLSSDAFASAWDEWIKYRSEKKKPITERTANLQLKFLLAQPNPVECIEQSIRNGWQGLFGEKENDRGKVLPSGPRPVKPSKPWQDQIIKCLDCGKDHKAGESCNQQ